MGRDDSREAPIVQCDVIVMRCDVLGGSARSLRLPAVLSVQSQSSEEFYSSGLRGALIDRCVRSRLQVAGSARSSAVPLGSVFGDGSGCHEAADQSQTRIPPQLWGESLKVA